MSFQSRLSANDKGHHEMKPVGMHSSPGINFTASPQMGPLPPNDVREGKERKKKRMGKNSL